MAATQLGIYNDALRLAAERRLVALTDAIEGRRLLDDAWVDAPLYCLEQAEWNFSMRAVELTYSTETEPPFGYKRAFEKPADWVRTSAVAYDDRFQVPITAYTDEQEFWFAEPDIIYVRFVSKDPSYGLSMSIWPTTFAKFLSAYLAREIAPKLTSGDKIIARAEKAMQHFMKEAAANNAINLPTTFAPEGAWLRARRGRLGSGWRDRGNQSQLIG